MRRIRIFGVVPGFATGEIIGKTIGALFILSEILTGLSIRMNKKLFYILALVWSGAWTLVAPISIFMMTMTADSPTLSNWLSSLRIGLGFILPITGLITLIYLLFALKKDKTDLQLWKVLLPLNIVLLLTAGSLFLR